MLVAAGHRLGAYEITGKLGEGGMGEVWRATDTRLRREVAIKVLPGAFTADAERLARFEREAQLLAQIHHPNIASIFGLEESDGTRALVMELVEGDDLAARIARGPLPLGEALAIAKQIAEALEAAHERGIVHRDLKPQNVKVRADGTVKVLDFGLAKAMEASAGAASAGAGGGAAAMASPTLMQSPTLTAAHGTQLGVILGTAAYMAPEQAKGAAVDKRADIWAFGVVLWEMLTGRRLFDGDSVAETLAGVLRSDVDLAALPAATPAALRRLLRRCLERNPKNRLHDIADARIVLDEVASGSTDGVVASPRPPQRAPWLRALPWALALLGVGFGAIGIWRGGRARAVTVDVGLGRPTRFHVPAPGPGEIDGFPAVAPDGRAVAFCFAAERGVPQLWLHSFDSGESRVLAGTEGARQPFWSPDGKHLAFFAAGQLRTLELSSGHVESIAAASDARGGAWTERGEIVYSSTCCSGFERVPAVGGDPRPLTQLDAAQGDASHRFPWALPGGDAVLFTIPSSVAKRAGLYWLSLVDGSHRLLMPEVARPIYDSRGFLIWDRDGSVVAQRFDARGRRLAGAPFVVAEKVGTDPEKSALDFFGVGGDTLVVRAIDLVQRELRWVDRRGNPQEAITPPGSYFDPTRAPDGRRVALARSNTATYYKSEVWLFDPSGHDRGTRLSFAGGRSPVWSPDAAVVYYAKDMNAEQIIVAKRVDGSGPEQAVMRSKSPIWPDDRSRREPLLVIEGSTREGTYKLSLLSLQGGGELRPFQQSSPGSQTHAMFSPDGKVLAYTSDESGVPQIYVQPVDGSPGRWQVTDAGGDLAAWRADGKELYYVGLDRVLRAVAVQSVQPFQRGETSELFALRIPQLSVTSEHAYYMPDADGQRFLVDAAVGSGADPGLQVTLGWLPARPADGGQP